MIWRLITFPVRYLVSRLKRTLGRLHELDLEVLSAYGNEDRLCVKGRVIEGLRERETETGQSLWKNVSSTLAYYARSAIADVEVELSCGHWKHRCVTDAEGIFSAEFEAPQELGEGLNYTEIRAKAKEGPDISWRTKEVRHTAMRCPSDTPLGIVSDLDDTVIISKATSRRRKFWLSLSKNAYTRKAFQGVTEFYKAVTLHGRRPIFYVSSSDWNLSGFIGNFLRYRDIPSGPLLLQDLHLNWNNFWRSGLGDHGHKREKIEQLMKFYPGMKFILAGDSGQEDIALYSAVADRFPHRVKVVYIRVVSPIKEEDEHRIEEMKKRKDYPPFLLVNSSSEALEDAERRGLAG